METLLQREESGALALGMDEEGKIEQCREPGIGGCGEAGQDATRGEGCSDYLGQNQSEDN